MLDFHTAISNYAKVEALRDLRAAKLAISQSIINEFVDSRSPHMVDLGEAAQSSLLAANVAGAVPCTLFFDEAKALFERLEGIHLPAFTRSESFHDLLVSLRADAEELREVSSQAPPQEINAQLRKLEQRARKQSFIISGESSELSAESSFTSGPRPSASDTGSQSLPNPLPQSSRMLLSLLPSPPGGKADTKVAASGTKPPAGPTSSRFFSSLLPGATVEPGALSA